MAGEGQIRGTLMRGPDGNLYFIPDTWLDSMRVPHESAHRVRRMHEEGGTESVHFAEAQLEPMAHIEGPALLTQIATQRPPGEE